MPDLVVHVVDDDAAMRDSITFLLSTDGIAARAYDSAGALLADAQALAPGCIVTDVRMPEMNGLELVAELKRLGVGLPVIVLTGHADVAMAVAAMKAGVLDFLEKPFEHEALLRAVRSALAAGEGDAHRARERAEVGHRLTQLTPRERDVFDAISSGESNKGAAQKLGISPRTVEIYRANVMTKMGAHTLSDLVRMAMLVESKS